MAWEIKEKKISEFEDFERRPRSKYQELYKKILNLKVGMGLEVETESPKQGDNVRNAINGMLRRQGLNEKYFASNRLSKVYIGRTK